MLIAKRYPEGKFPPKRSSGRNIWHVHCVTGALQVLRDPEFLKVALDNPRNNVRIIFDDESAALVTPDDELWKELERFIAIGFRVEVFPFVLRAEFVPWTGDLNTREFDAIQIRKS